LVLATVTVRVLSPYFYVVMWSPNSFHMLTKQKLFSLVIQNWEWT